MSMMTASAQPPEEKSVMSFATLSALALGVVLLVGIVLALLPEGWQGQQWYSEPSSLFSFVALIVIVTVLVAPHS